MVAFTKTIGTSLLPVGLLASLLTAHAPAMAGIAGTVRLTHLTTAVIDLDSGDGLAPSVQWANQGWSASATNQDGVTNFAGGDLGSPGTAANVLGSLELSASNIDFDAKHFYGSQVSAKGDAGPFFASVFNYQDSSIEIGGNTRLVIYGQLDMQVVSTGGQDLFGWGSIGTTMFGLTGQIQTFTSKNISVNVGPGVPGSSFSGTIAWRIDNPGLFTRRVGVSVDVGLQSFGEVPANGSAIPSLPVLPAELAAPPEMPIFLPSPVPEPATSFMLLAGLGCVAMSVRRRAGGRSATPARPDAPIKDI